MNHIALIIALIDEDLGHGIADLEILEYGTESAKITISICPRSSGSA
jgi:hypothetical protein